MTDTASPITPQSPADDEDAKLARFGYTQKLDRSVGRLASFAIGFATISATTAVFTGFGAGYLTAGGPFVWTLLLAAAVFVVWVVIAADLTAKIPLAGYAYQWTSRIHGSNMAWFTGVMALVGWISGMTGVGYILSGYLGSLFNWNMSQTAQILVSIGVMAVCTLVNLYGVRFATMVNNIGVSLELVVTVAATILVAIVAFSAPDRHQPLSVLFNGTSDGSNPYILAWLAASLGPFFGLIGVEASADVAEETVNARHVIPRTMFYALATSVVIEFGMYVVYVLAIRDQGAVANASAAPIEEIINEQLGPAITKIVVAVALTNVMACILANILVATRLTYSMARDNMLPFSHVWRHVSPSNRTPTYAVIGLFVLSTLLLLSALISEKAFNLIIGLSSLTVFATYVLQTVALIIGRRRGTIPVAEPGTFDLGRARMPVYVLGLICFTLVCVALIFLPQFAGNGYVFLGLVVLAGLWSLTGLRKRLATSPNFPIASTHFRKDCEMTVTTSLSSNLVAVEPGAIREDTPAGSVIQYSDYELDTSSPYAGGVAWIEGEYIPAEDAKISIFDTGFGHSDVTYTVAHVWHGNVFRLGDHIDRLLDGAAKLRLDAGLSKDELAEITRKCISLSQLRESFVNLSITRGYGKKKGEKDLTKLTHQVYIYAIPYLWAFPPAEQIFGTTAIVPRHVRRAGRNTVDPTIKNYQWGDLTAASFEAKDRGARTAILLDSDNCVAEGPGFNVVIVKDGKFASPSRNALPGITRKTVYELADQMCIEATLRDVTSRELYDADEIMAVTTAGGVTPINTLDGEPIGNGEPGPLTVKIRDRFWALMDEPGPLVEAIDY
jgi:amino acid transporter/branched-subunit amino acid aminotransferase/4-amino-4-deoxychorismate lyase